MSNHGLQFIERHITRCAVAIERGDVTIQVTPELLVAILKDCGRVLALIGANERLKEGIEDIANRVDDWTDHDGIGPREALLALIGDGDAEK